MKPLDCAQLAAAFRDAACCEQDTTSPASWPLPKRQRAARSPGLRCNLDHLVFCMETEHLPSDEACLKGTRDWPHAPPHRLASSGVYFVTARSRNQHHLLADDRMKDWFQDTLFRVIDEYGWRLEAWCVLSNHYHFIAHSPGREAGGAVCLKRMIRKLHAMTTMEINRSDGITGRSRLWQNYRETHLTHQRSYLARLHYVHQNAVHHGLVRVGSDWKWCSARRFKEAVTPAWLKTITSFRYDEIAAKDGE